MSRSATIFPPLVDAKTRASELLVSLLESFKADECKRIVDGIEESVLREAKIQAKDRIQSLCNDITALHLACSSPDGGVRMNWKTNTLEYETADPKPLLDGIKNCEVKINIYEEISGYLDAAITKKQLDKLEARAASISKRP